MAKRTARATQSFAEFAVDPNQPETYDPNNPGGNAVYFLAFAPVEQA